MRSEKSVPSESVKLIQDKLDLLVVEDSASDFELLIAELERSRIDFTAVRVQTRTEFERALRKQPPDVIISDYTLPRFNGLEVLQIVKEVNPLIPVIITTGSINEETAVGCIKAGAVDYVLKEHITRIGPAVKGALTLAKERRANEASQRELLKLSSAIQQSADNVVITGADGIIVFVNPAFERTTGYTAAEVIGKNPRILKSGLQSPEYYETMWKIIKSGKTFQAEFVNRKKSGELYYDEKTITPILDHQGKITNFIATGRDITDRKRAEEQLRRSEERFSTVFKSSPVGISIT
ncbi:MAG TPA: PAS domain S-box protein, partial [Bacteroidota bacterium]|nr:PAS domain S-box protein [Bacteroidota bacterium]